MIDPRDFGRLEGEVKALQLRLSTHTSGSATDGVGGVSWTHVDSGDRTIFGINQYGRFLIGAGSYDESIVYKVAPTDPSGVFSFHGKSTGVSKVAALRLTPTNGGGAETLTPYLRADASAGMQVMKSDGSAALMTWSDAGGLQHGEIARTFATAADNDTTPSAEGLSALWLANTSPTSITTLDDGSDGQEVESLRGQREYDAGPLIDVPAHRIGQHRHDRWHGGEDAQDPAVSFGQFVVAGCRLCEVTRRFLPCLSRNP